MCKGWTARKNGLSLCLSLRSDAAISMCAAGDLSGIFTLVGEDGPMSSYLDVLLSWQTKSPKMNSLSSFANLSSQP